MKRLLLLSFLLISLFTNGWGQTVLKEKKAFDYFLKVTDLDKRDFSTEYLFLNGTDIYDQYEEDEFEFQEKVNEYYHELIKNSSSSIENNFFMITRSEFGEYDFESQSFQYSDFPSTTYVTLKNATTGCAKCKTHTEIKLFFLNAGVNSFPVDPTNANLLIKNRKNSAGTVNREVYLKIYFSLAEKHETEVKGDWYDVKLYANISKIEFLDFYGYDYQGSGKVITTVYPDSVNEESKQGSIKANDDSEVAKVKAYIENSKIDPLVKVKLLEVLNSN